MSQKKGWSSNLFSFFSYIRSMGEYYLGLLLKYKEQEKIKKRREIEPLDFSGVWFPKINRVFPHLLSDEILSTNQMKLK